MRKLDRYDAVAIFSIGLTGPILLAAISLSCDRVIEPTFAGDQRWASVPIGVSVSPDFDWDRELDLAIDNQNRTAGCVIFERDPAGPIHVSIGSDNPAYPERRGWVEVSAIGNRITRAEISVHAVADTRTAYNVLLHELGGALILDYDMTLEHSSRHPNIAGQTGLVFITHRDGNAVRGRYCP